MTTTSGSPIAGGIVCLIMGILVMVTGVFLSISEKEFQEKALTTTAVITDIDTHITRKKGKTKKDHDVYVEYEVGGQKYRSELNVYKSSMREGNSIEVFYDPANPKDARVKAGGVNIILVVIGAFVFILGIRTTVVSIKNRIRN